jgi:hypothetical protein
MKKKTIIIVSLALIFAIVAIIAIARVPKQKIKQELSDVKNPVIQNDKVDIEVNSQPSGPETPGDDGYYLDETGENGIVLLPPSLDSNSDLSDINELQTVDKAGSAVLKAELGAFKDGATATLKKLGVFSKEYMRAEVLTKGYANKFTAYKYSATKNGKEYLTAGRVKIVISIPRSYDIDKVSVCYMFDDHLQELNCYINKEKRTLVVNATATGVYLLVEEKPVTNKPSDDTSSDSSSSDSTSSNTNSSNNSTSSMPEGDPETMEGWTPWF